ncbi:hypothetical protein Q4511_14800 [Paracoccus sp. 1_MG-2023]|uniref:hypothetical protein n=1 Tax=unclassified Paracoccus (in: a-proteobacteria) TaxID=2688777 RepID=UPI001C093768|nr:MULTISPECIES: hypothetical protein [unclassified Paracoccus (in: a-proteobacteria)]MBU2956809.1 hypothetical protein [Paracoccus sp. C2R09]MDO6670194.1 hypothetical protein [Paracoccus sp. 1_MG-2023]
MRSVIRHIATLIAVILLIALASCGWHSRGGDVTAPPDDGIRIASLNTHYIMLDRQDGPWTVEGWDRRKGAMAEVLRNVDADILAFQEMESFRRGDGSTNLTYDFLRGQFPGYSAGATGDWQDFPTTQPVFFRSDRFEEVDQGWFFFSETPDTIYSCSFDGSFPAFA